LSIPDFQTLTLPVLRIAAEGEVRISEVVERLAVEFALSAEERTHLLPSGRQTTFANRVHWAKTYLAKAGLVELTRRAYFRITELGRQVLAAPPERLDLRYLNRYPGIQQFRKTSEDKEIDDAVSVSSAVGMSQILTPDEVMRSAHRQLELALADELMQRIRSGTPEFFESLVVRLLVGMGYGGSITDVNKALVGGSGDGGVDGVIDQDQLGLDRIYVQAKRYAESNVVGPGAIRDFFGSLDRFKATKGLFVTASTFSSSAKETAEHLSKRIVLIDGDHLTRLMIRHEIGCRVEETLYVKKVDEEFFE
jgi:restriction system protein